jgi:dolichol kinase
MKNFINRYLQDSDFNHEVRRKLFHICTIAILPIIYIFLQKKQMIAIVLPISSLIIAIDFYRHKSSVINKIFQLCFSSVMRKKDFLEASWTGASSVAISAAITFVIFPKIIAICAFSILAVSDCLAALVGKKIISKEFFEKSVAGSTAFGVSALIILIICGLFTQQSLSYYFFGTFAVFVTTIIEARPSFFNLDDNFVIPLTFSVVMMFFGIVWGVNY